MASSGAGVELKSFENLAPQQKPELLKFSRLHQPWLKMLIFKLKKCKKRLVTDYLAPY